MTKKSHGVKIRSTDAVFADDADPSKPIPILFVGESHQDASQNEKLSDHAKRWLTATDFKSKPGNVAPIPGSDGQLEAVVFGIGDGTGGEPCGPAVLQTGKLAKTLPSGTYALSCGTGDAQAAALSWGLGGYRFDVYREASQTKGDGKSPRLVVPDTVDRAALQNTVEAVWLGRDLINTPASDLGPEELEDAARHLAQRHGATFSVITGDALLEQNFPLIHAVGRASPRAPRLIEFQWTPDRSTAQPRKTLTLIGKGICFDTGGLNLKPGDNMLLMKKDMGGAATVLSLAHMIMGQNLDIDLRVLIPAAENSVSGNAFRPSDIITSRSGRTVEIGNTDAEGRLVLADALTYADNDEPDAIITCATLTGAARVALGPDLPALFSTDAARADAIVQAGHAIGDPLWPMPFWPGYESMLESSVADTNHIGGNAFAGAIIAALFLKSFVKKTQSYDHVDLYGWRPNARAMTPKGGEPQSARALFAMLKNELTA